MKFIARGKKVIHNNFPTEKGAFVEDHKPNSSFKIRGVRLSLSFKILNVEICIFLTLPHWQRVVYLAAIAGGKRGRRGTLFQW